VSASLCCIDIKSDIDSSTTTVELADPPCHGKASDANSNNIANPDQKDIANTENGQCCASCLLLAAPLFFIDTPSGHAGADINTSIAQLISKHPVQPFRPPITNLA
jgi:hypothetical protein